MLACALRKGGSRHDLDFFQRPSVLQGARLGDRGFDRPARVRGHALAQSGAPSGGFLEHEAVTPPLLFREVWQQPPHTGPLNDENRRITPQA